MGSGQSVRATHFQRPSSPDATAGEPLPEPDDDVDAEHHISISNKIVERLVEDATLAGGAAAAVAASSAERQASGGDFREKVNMEKLKCMDQKHSERSGLTIQDVKALAKRIELRTASMLRPEPVCADFSQRVIDCYNATDNPQDTIKCWDTVGEFSKCVQDAATARLHARTQKEARELERRSRHVSHAREHALRDLGPPPHPTAED